MTVKERVLKFIEAKELNAALFERKCDLSNGYVNNIRQSIGRISLEKILRTFPELSREWLLFGDGEMLVIEPDVENDVNSEPESKYEIDKSKHSGLRAMETINNLSETVKSQQDLISKMWEKLSDDDKVSE